MKISVIVFPGSNCDRDVYNALDGIMNLHVDYVFHKETNLDPYDMIILPGGFSYGDYLRPGAFAKLSPIMSAVEKANEQGKLIIGICNGFQILTESGLLPGALVRNGDEKFICENRALKVINNQSIFTDLYFENEIVNMPIAHADGRYYCDSQTLRELKENNQILFKYVVNPNGSVGDIAGIINKKGNILGMMPHPERAVERILGSTDGLAIFRSIIQNEHF
tara:strand:+ start:40 stop:705 length:666 start_codon:yes stop_codon:yes gene_type:complete